MNVLIWPAIIVGLPITALVLAFAFARWQRVRRERRNAERLWYRFYEGRGLR